MNKSFWYAVSILSGTMIGVGMFALPYVFYKAGFFVALLQFVVLFFAMLVLHLMMSEVVLRTRQKHRFVGYVEYYLGNGAKRIVTVTNILTVAGTLLAYILVSGIFLKVINESLFSSSEKSQVFFWLLMSFIVFLGIKTVKKAEFLFVVFLAVFLAVLFVDGKDYINFNNFLTFNPKDFFLPYGAILYSFAGISAVPVMRDMLFRQEKKLKKAVAFGFFVSALFYLVFVSVVVGVSGKIVTEDALSGLDAVVGNGIAFLGAVFGIFAVATSYLIYAFYLKQTLMYDFKLKENLSLAFVVLVPIFLVYTISSGFLDVIIFLGAVFGGIESIVLIALYKKAKKIGDRKPEYSFNIPNVVFLVMSLIFVFGIVYEIFYNL